MKDIAVFRISMFVIAVVIFVDSARADCKLRFVVESDFVKSGWLIKLTPGWDVELELKELPAKKLEDITKANIGKILCLVVGDKVVATPFIAATVQPGTVIGGGRFTERSEACRLLEGFGLECLERTPQPKGGID